MTLNSANLVGRYIDRAIALGRVGCQADIATALDLSKPSPYAWRNPDAPEGWISPMRIPSFASACGLTRREAVELLLIRVDELDAGQNVKASKETLLELIESIVSMPDPQQWILDAVEAETDDIGYRSVLHPTPQAILQVRRLANRLVSDANDDEPAV